MLCLVFSLALQPIHSPSIQLLEAQVNPPVWGQTDQYQSISPFFSCFKFLSYAMFLWSWISHGSLLSAGRRASASSARHLSWLLLLGFFYIYHSCPPTI